LNPTSRIRTLEPQLRLAVLSRPSRPGMWRSALGTNSTNRLRCRAVQRRPTEVRAEIAKTPRVIRWAVGAQAGSRRGPRPLLVAREPPTAAGRARTVPCSFSNAFPPLNARRDDRGRGVAGGAPSRVIAHFRPRRVQATPPIALLLDPVHAKRGRRDAPQPLYLQG
jgi:hypothetical protein